MASPDLLMVCVSSFTAVFVVLGILAIIMRGIVALFPARLEVKDDVTVAAIAAVAAQHFPWTTVTKVEEIK